MSRLPSVNIPAPVGMDTTSDPVQTSVGKAQLLVNFQCNYPGKIRAVARLVDVLPLPLSHPIDGLAYYYQASLTNVPAAGTPPNLTDILLFFSNGVLYYTIPSADPFTTRFSIPIAVSATNQGNTYFPGGVFPGGGHVRSAALNDELIFVQQGGIAPQRFYASPTYPGPHFRQAGIVAPPAPTSSNGGGTGPTGTYTYKQTYYDERGRESSPSPISTPLTVADDSIQVVIAWNVNFPRNGFDGQIVGSYVYRNTDGGTVWYRVGNVLATNDPTKSTPYTLTIGDWLLHLGVANDTATDLEISTQPICPNAGEYDVPNPASVIAVHKNKVFLNDVTNNAVVQASVTSSPTQFTSFESVPIIETDGAILTVGSDQGDPVQALVEFGSVLAIFKRRGTYFLWGDNITNFSIQPVHTIGCIAPDSAVRCNNVVPFLSDDWVYAASYGQAGESVEKISLDIEKWLLSFSETDRENALGWFRNNRYYLAVASVIFAYDFTSQGWTSFIFGMGTFDLGIPGFPPVLIIPPSAGGNQGGSITLPDGGALPDTGSGSPPGMGGGSGSGGIGPSVPSDNTGTGGGPPSPSPP